MNIMVKNLRNYQQELSSKILSRDDNCLIQLDTGAGKTAIIADITKKLKGKVVVIAHTRLLIKQLKNAVGNAEIVGVRTAVIRKVDVSDATLIIDEAHHVAEENQWHSLAKKAKRTIGFTATPHRLDKESLKCAFDALLQADELADNSVSKLIGRGILSDFVAYSAITKEELKSDSLLKMGRHDYTQTSLEKNMDAKVNLVCSSVIKEYKEKAFGKSAICFCVSVKLATKQAELFNKAGIRSAVVSSKHSKSDNDRNIQLFKEGFIDILCHVDMFGEGIDIPALDCIIMTRKTASLSLYRQWCGRALRVCDGKDKAIILDHVGNIATHGLPDRNIKWSLNGIQTSEQALTKICRECDAVNKYFAKTCRNCGTTLLKAGASKPIIQKENLEHRLKIWEREQERIEEEKQEKLWRENNVIKPFSINNAPKALKTVLEKRVFNEVIKILKEQGKETRNINKMIDNTKDYKVWVKYFHNFDLSKAEVFYNEYSK